MQLTFQPEPAEIRRAVMLLFRQRSPRVLGILCVLLGIAIALSLSPYSHVASLFYAATFAGGLLTIRFLSLTRRNLQQAYQRLGCSLYDLSADGIRIQSPAATIHLPWREFSDTIRQRDLIVLQQANHAVLILPTRAFTATQLASLDHYLQAPSLGPVRGMLHG